MEKAVLAFTDGYTLTLDTYDSADEAKAAMEKQYESYHCPDKDLYEESYINSTSAKVVITSEDIYMWAIWAIRIVK